MIGESSRGVATGFHKAISTGGLRGAKNLSRDFPVSLKDFSRRACGRSGSAFRRSESGLPDSVLERSVHSVAQRRWGLPQRRVPGGGSESGSQLYRTLPDPAEDHEAGVKIAREGSRIACGAIEVGVRDLKGAPELLKE